MDPLEAKKQELLEKLKNVAIDEATCSPQSKLMKMDVLHKRINAISRYQAEHVTVPAPVSLP